MRYKTTQEELNDRGKNIEKKQQNSLLWQLALAKNFKSIVELLGKKGSNNWNRMCRIFVIKHTHLKTGKMARTSGLSLSSGMQWFKWQKTCLNSNGISSKIRPCPFISFSTGVKSRKQAKIQWWFQILAIQELSNNIKKSI